MELVIGDVGYEEYCITTKQAMDTEVRGYPICRVGLADDIIDFGGKISAKTQAEEAPV